MLSDDCIAKSEKNHLTPPINDFTVSLFHRLAVQAGQDNALVSPAGISTALSMLMLGARSETERQLRSALTFDRLDAGLNVHSLFQEVSHLLHS